MGHGIAGRAEVTGVESTRKIDMLRSFGADHVIDYTAEDFTKTGHHYDLIIDVVVWRSISDYTRALNPTYRCPPSKGYTPARNENLSNGFQVAVPPPLIRQKVAPFRPFVPGINRYQRRPIWASVEIVSGFF